MVHSAPHNNTDKSTPSQPGFTEDFQSVVNSFDLMSEQLNSSYQWLESKVNELSGQLQHANHLRSRESDRLNSLLDMLPGGVVVLDNRGIICDCNPAAVDFLGEPLEGQRWVDVIQRNFSPRSDDGHEISLKDGRRISIATSSLADNGQIILLTDQTETRELQARLSRHQRLSAMGNMISSLAHQLRTPLSSALLYAGHLTNNQTLSSQQQQKFAGKLLTRLRNMEDQIRDMLIFAKGDIQVAEQITVGELAAEIIRANEDSLSHYKARFAVSCDENLKELRLACNRQIIVGAFSNLINNALQAVNEQQLRHGRDCKPLIRLAFAESDGQLTVWIEDNGPGFTADSLKGIEEAFYTTKSTGTGLGLAVVKAIALAHQGEMKIDQHCHDGARVGIELPILQRA